MNLLPHVLAGRIKALAVMSESRWFAAPDVPTIAEAGVPGLSIRFWNGLWAPKGTPNDIVAKLNAVVRGALADPVLRKRLADLGNEIPPPDEQTPEALAAFHRAEVERWWPIIKAAGITAD
jgi:tripartite-type tricarboxylate transporter receptor subunit TctC